MRKNAVILPLKRRKICGILVSHIVAHGDTLRPNVSAMIGTQAMSNNRSLSYQSRNFHLIIFDFFQWTYIVDRINFVSPPICDTACDFNINHIWVFLQYIFTLPAFGFYPNKKDSKTSLPKR